MIALCGRWCHSHAAPNGASRVNEANFSFQLRLTFLILPRGYDEAPLSGSNPNAPVSCNLPQSIPRHDS